MARLRGLECGMRINGSSDMSPVRLALRGTLPQPVISRRLSNWTAFTVEFYRSRDVDVDSSARITRYR